MAKTTRKKAKTTMKAAAKARTKSDIYAGLAEFADLTRKQVSAVFDGVATMMKKDLTRGPKVFSVPGLMKVTVVHKPATKARKGINPFTGEPTVFKAKPARKVVKVRPLKGLKDMVR